MSCPPLMTIKQSRGDYHPQKGSPDHVSHFSEAHHNWTQQGRTPRSPIFDHHQTPTDTSSAHPPSRCVPTTTPSAARRSTPARCVLKFTPSSACGRRMNGNCAISTTTTPRHCDLTNPFTYPTSRTYVPPISLKALVAHTIFISLGCYGFANVLWLVVG